jgi:hypothetical protein
MNRTVSICVIFLIAVVGFHGQEIQQSSPAQTQWIAASLKTMQTIKPGMARADLLKVFTTEGGISTRRQRRYIFRECPYIKVLVEFDPVDDRDFVESPSDRITKISQPFLEWTIAD